jgi:hypothetical protein
VSTSTAAGKVLFKPAACAVARLVGAIGDAAAVVATTDADAARVKPAGVSTSALAAFALRIARLSTTRPKSPTSTGIA